jgi:hypothetical protein
VQQHLGRLDGVSKVEVSLLGGKVAILAKPDGKLDPNKIFKATYDSGVTVAEMTITATGSIERDAAQQLQFRVDGDQAFPLRPDARALELEPLAGTGRTVTLRGRLYAKPAKNVKQKPAVQPMETLEIIRK